MTLLTEQTYPGEFIISELGNRGSRDDVTVTAPADTKLVPGTVLGKITATGKYAPYDDRDTDGREEASAILYATVDNSAGGAPTDFTECVVLNWTAEVRKTLLSWVVGADQANGLADLAALGIKARD